MINKQVWTIVECLSQEVVKKDNLTLNEEELDLIFQTSGYNAYWGSNKPTLLKPFEQRNDPDSAESQLKRMMASNNIDIFPPNDRQES